LIFTLAFRNLIHDHLSSIATVVGVVFSIVLVTVQMGLYFGFGRMVTMMIDHTSADLWIMPIGTKCFEDPSLLDERKRYQALAIDGVTDVVPVVIGYADWRIPALPHDTPAPSVDHRVRSPSQIRGDLARGIFRGAHKIEARASQSRLEVRPNWGRSLFLF
jgi:hypothetical protein